MAITYFGNNGSSANLYTQAPGSMGLIATCPGSGDQVVKSIGALCTAEWQGGNIRFALYSSDLATLICEGSAEKAISTYNLSWHEQDDTEITPSPCTITGGTDYCIVVTWDTSESFRIAYPASGIATIKNYTDYTGGFPEPISLPTADIRFYIRCGVEPAATNNALFFGQNF